MGVTHFPDGINAGSEAGASAPLQVGGVAINPLHYASAGREIVAGTVIVPAAGSTAFIPAGLTAAEYGVACPYGALASTAGTTGGFVYVTAAVSGGTLTLRGYDQMGTASSTAGTAVYFAVGTA